MKSARELGTDGASALPLRIDGVADEGEDFARTLCCTDIERTELRVAVDELPTADPPWETDEWYRFDGVARSDSLGTDLQFSPRTGRLEHIDPPDSRTHPSSADLDDPWLIQLGASDEVVAVTVQPRPTGGREGFSAGDPETYEIGAVCFGHGDGTVYHRENPETRDEHLLLQHVVRDLSEAAGATLVTNGADPSPLEMLHARLGVAAEGDVVESGAKQVLADCFHADLHRTATRAGDDTLRATARRLGVEVSPVDLSDYDLRLDPADWRDGWETDASDSRMTDRDYTTLVERYLEADEESAASTDLGRCLKAYASADVPLLQKLATGGAVGRLACPRLAESLPQQG